MKRWKKRMERILRHLNFEIVLSFGRTGMILELFLPSREYVGL
jgi:hypothetical protein